MPSVTVGTSHNLGQEEALRRLKDEVGTLKATHHDRFSDLHEEWNSGTLSFRFKAGGMKVAGTVTVEDSQVKLDVKLPLVAIMFKGMIKARVGEQLGILLA